jgi:20S proteasome alpha/beta subunit
MSQIIGIVCKDAIVFGAESETTRGSAKQHGTEKISIVNFPNGYAMIAEAGAEAWSNSAVESFRRKAAVTKIVDDMTIPNTVKESILEIRNHMKSLHPDTLLAEWENFFYQEANDFELTVGYYFSGTPHIFKFHPFSAYPYPNKREFVTSGIGGDLAHYLLKDFSFGQIPAHATTLIAAYVLQEVKGSTQYCGGATSIALVSDGNRPEKMSASEVDSMEAQIAEMRLVENDNRLKKLNDLVDSTCMAYQAGTHQSSV